MLGNSLPCKFSNRFDYGRYIFHPSVTIDYFVWTYSKPKYLSINSFSICRYWAVTNVDYIHSRTTGRVFMMIFFVWVTGVIVSLAPQFGWKDPEYLQRIEQQKCMVSQDIGYQVRSSISCTGFVTNSGEMHWAISRIPFFIGHGPWHALQIICAAKPKSRRIVRWSQCKQFEQLRITCTDRNSFDPVHGEMD